MQRPNFKWNMVLMVFFVSFIATSMIISTPMVQASPTTYYVSTSGSDSNGGTSWSDAWRHIDYAVDNVGVGDTVLVKAGTYDETVTVDTEDLTIKSNTKHGAVIQPSTAGSVAVKITKDGVTIDGFEVTGDLKNGIEAYGVSDVTISNNKVHGATNCLDGIGIFVWDWDGSKTVDRATIENNIVYDTGRMGIFCMDLGGTSPITYDVTEGHTISGNTVYDTWQVGWGDDGGGIQINVGKDCSITDNLVYNTKEGRWGIYMFGSASGNTITGNTVRNNKIGIGLWISGEGGTSIDWEGDSATFPQVHCNNIYDNTDYGAVSYNVAGTTMVMDAENNWWGAASGPSGEGLGSGDAVSENVDFDPWAKNYPACAPVCAPVGGVWVTIDKTRLLTPWIGLASLITIVAASIAYVKRRKKQHD